MGLDYWIVDAGILVLRHQIAVLQCPVNAPQRAVGGAAAGPGERILGLPADPRRAGRARHHRGAVHGLADPQERRDRPGAAPRRAGLAGVPAVPGAGDPGAGLLHRRPAQRRPRSTSWPRSSTAPAASGSLGATEHPVQAWVVQQARNLLMDLEDAGTRVKFVLHDRDASFTAAFDAVFRAAGARVIRSAVQAPRMNSVMERWIGSCRRELLDRTLVWNQRHLMIVLREYEDFYNTHRPHRSPEAGRAAPPAARRRHRPGPVPGPAT